MRPCPDGRVTWRSTQSSQLVSAPRTNETSGRQSTPIHRGTKAGPPPLRQNASRIVRGALCNQRTIGFNNVHYSAVDAGRRRRRSEPRRAETSRRAMAAGGGISSNYTVEGTIAPDRRDV